MTSVSRLLLALSLLSLWGCASTPELDIVLGESPRGAVYLERIPDRSFQAAHPIKIEQATIERVLRGILVQDHQGLLQNFLAGQPSAISVFTEEDVRYLSPLLVEGLLRAAPDQQIGFRLIQSGTPKYSQGTGAGVGSSEPPLQLSPTETTRASLYAYGRSLYVTLHAYRHRPERPDTIAMANRRIPDATGLANRTVLFTPESAKRPDSYRGKNSTDTTLVIDYELLATLPTNTTAPASHVGPSPGTAPPAAAASSPDAATDSQLRSLQEQMRQKNVELDELRKELQDIRRQLIEPAKTPPASAR